MKSILQIWENEQKSRRQFLEFFGRTSAALALTSFAHPLAKPLRALAGPEIMGGERHKVTSLPFSPLAPSRQDALEFAKGFNWKVLISWGDVINSKLETFGFNNDYIAFTPLNSSSAPSSAPSTISKFSTSAPSTDNKVAKNKPQKDSGIPDSGMLWVNHETANPLFVSGLQPGETKSKEQVIKEQLAVGGTLLKVIHKNGQWDYVKSDPLNRRLHARTEIPLISTRPIMGATKAIGTLGNCAGGVTPWNSILTCEENYDVFYGEASYEGVKGSERKLRGSRVGWEKYFDYPPEHYGWVVEVNPLTGAAKKLTALGRFAHECATVTTAKDGRCVVYMGDDAEDRSLYKFIADRTGSLETGTLYVASLESGKWLPLVYEKNENLRKWYADQTDVLIRCREAASTVGGSILDRPEDIEIDPASGAIFVALTNNSMKKNYYGSILKLVEADNNPLSLEFSSSKFLAGGTTTGLACPDNLAFDRKGNLWVTTDFSDPKIGQGPYSDFGNNSLFYIPMSGPEAGRAFRVANSPTDAELTGPCFSPDGRTLFLSVQHPGEGSISLKNPTSRWPGGGNSTPKPSVVTITGPALDALI